MYVSWQRNLYFMIFHALCAYMLWCLPPLSLTQISNVICVTDNKCKITIRKLLLHASTLASTYEYAQQLYSYLVGTPTAVLSYGYI